MEIDGTNQGLDDSLPAEGEIDPAEYLTDNLDDPDLVSAYAAENEAIRLDRNTLGVAWIFGIIPFALVLTLLSALLGDRVWVVLPVCVIALFVWHKLMSLGLFRRYQSDLPIHLPGGVVFRGAAKKQVILAAIGLAGLYALKDIGERFVIPMVRNAMLDLSPWLW
ncbi:MAG: hypothetical protein J7493_14310 [Porphyrobacter sp.]|nr:hypothetical protein [Porphyrobacter sp.]